MSMFSQIMPRSGTHMDTGRKSALSDSGSSARPGYPGFMVMNAIVDGLNEISTSSNMNCDFLARMASNTVLYCVEHTDKTATGIRLNSSKHPQAPVCANPLYVLPIAL